MIEKYISRDIWIGGLTKNELLQNLKDNNIGINEFGLQIFEHCNFTTLPVKKKLLTIEISVGDLGFLNGAFTEEVYKNAEHFGLSVCPAELGPHMRLQYIDLNQPFDPTKGRWQTIAMNELSNELDFPKGFYLRRCKDGFWLRGYRASVDHLWNPDDRFIFVQI